MTLLKRRTLDQDLAVSCETLQSQIDQGFQAHLAKLQAGVSRPGERGITVSPIKLETG